MRGEHLLQRLDQPPVWLPDLIAHLATTHAPSRACVLITHLARLLDDEHPDLPQSLLERARQPGRSMGSLARAMQDFFTAAGLAMPTNHTQLLAAGRRQRRIDAVPDPLRQAVAAFENAQMKAQDRARRAGTRPRRDHTLETALAIIRDLALFLISMRGKTDWAQVDVHDVEAFLATLAGARKRRLVVLRQFFRFARVHRLLLVDPTRSLAAKEPRGFRGPTLTLDQQRALFQRWTNDQTQAHPHEALVGILALLHGASSGEARTLQISDIDHDAQGIRLGRRPHLIPLDPVTWQVMQRCLRHREMLRTSNPHVLVTRGTKAGRQPPSTAYMAHVLDACGFPPRTIRSTRLIDLVNALDPKLVASAFGMTAESTLIYLADRVDPSRLPTHLGGEPPHHDNTARTRRTSPRPDTSSSEHVTPTKMAAKHKAKIVTPNGPRTCFEAIMHREGQEPTGRQVRRHPPPAAENGGHRRLPTGRATLPAKRAGHPAPQTAM